MREIGGGLKRAREARGISLESAAQVTKIKQEYLESMEAGRFELLPSPAYSRGFIKIYCRFLDADPEPVVEAYAASSHPVDEALVLDRSRTEPIPRFSRIKTRSVLLAVGAAAAAGLLILGFLRLGASLVAPGTDRTGFEVVESPYLPGSDARIPLTAGAAAEDSARLILEIRAAQDAWIEVSPDGVLKFFSTLKKGDAYQGSARDYFSVKVAVPDRVEFFLDGKRLPLPSDLPSPARLRVTRSGVRAQ